MFTVICMKSFTLREKRIEAARSTKDTTIIICKILDVSK